jgi:hypothetical protein
VSGVVPSHIRDIASHIAAEPISWILLVAAKNFADVEGAQLLKCRLSVMSVHHLQRVIQGCVREPL